MNRSTILRILRALTIVAVLALAAVGLEHLVADLSQGSGSGPRTQARVVQPEVPSATVTAPPPVQIQPTATATATALPPAQIQPTATATVTAPPPVQVKVEGRITAVNAAAGTITVQHDDGGPATVVALGAARGTYYVGEKLKVVGTLTGAGGSAATVQAQYVTPDDAPAPTAAIPVGTHVKVEGRITAVNAAAGTITVQHDDGGPAAVVALGAARGTFYVGQEVEVAGIRARAGSNGATVQAQFIRLKSPDGD